jgi:hypothetical protein
LGGFGLWKKEAIEEHMMKLHTSEMEQPKEPEFFELTTSMAIFVALDVAFVLTGCIWFCINRRQKRPAQANQNPFEEIHGAFAKKSIEVEVQVEKKEYSENGTSLENLAGIPDKSFEPPNEPCPKSLCSEDHASKGADIEDDLIARRVEAALKAAKERSTTIDLTASPSKCEIEKRSKAAIEMAKQRASRGMTPAKSAPGTPAQGQQAAVPESIQKAPAVQQVPVEVKTTENARHVFFDFDQTISVIHVFKQVAGWEPGVTPPHALSERGQIHRIEELCNAGKWSPANQTTGTPAFQLPTGTPTKCCSGSSWTAAVLGGAERVGRLHAFFSKLKEAGVKMTIITKGNVGACRCLLAQENLLTMFERVFGMVGETYGLSQYDKEHLEPSEYEGTADEHELLGTKAELIRLLMQSEGLTESQAVLVEDDRAEIASVQGICKSVLVASRRGIGDAEMASIYEMTGLDSPKDPALVAPKLDPKHNWACVTDLDELFNKAEETNSFRDVPTPGRVRSQ